MESLRKSTKHIETDGHKWFSEKSIKILKEIYAARYQQIRYENNEIGKLAIFSGNKSSSIDMVPDGDAKLFLTLPKFSEIKTEKGSKATKIEKVKQEPMEQEIHDSSREESTGYMDKVTSMGLEDLDLIPIGPASAANGEGEGFAVDSRPSTISNVEPNQVGVNNINYRCSQSLGGLPDYPAKPLVASQKPLTGRSAHTQAKKQSHHRTMRHRSQSKDLRVDHARRPHAAVEQSTEPEGKAVHHRSRIASNSRKARTGLTEWGRSSPPTSLAAQISSALQARGNQKYNNNRRQPRVGRRTYPPPPTPSNSQSDMLSPSTPPSYPDYTAFSGSSSGVVGLTSKGLTPSSQWQNTTELSRMRQFGAMPMNGHCQVYNERADPNAILTSCPSDVTSSFSSDHSGHSLSNELHISGLTQGVQSLYMPSNPGTVIPQLRNEFPTYLSTSFDTLPVQPGTQGYLPSYIPSSLTSYESIYSPYNQSQYSRPSQQH